jgi:hypothetical protein
MWPVWTVSEPGSELGHSVELGDVDGDGFDDMLVGAPASSALGADQGAAYLYGGASTGLSTTPVWSATGEPWSRFGASVAVCDVDGDGFVEVVVGAWATDTETGAVTVYRGSPAGPSPTPDWVLVGASRWDRFGEYVGCAGDVDGDGDEELVVNAPGEGSAGAAHLYAGDPSGLQAVPAWSVHGTAATRYHSIGAAGDVNNDGLGDVYLTAYSYLDGSMVFVYHGSPNGLISVPDTQLFGVPNVYYGPSQTFGESVAGGVDVNSDGYEDVLVSDSDCGGFLGLPESSIQLYYGGPTGLDPTPAWRRFGPRADETHADLAPDVDGDLQPDILFGWIGPSPLFPNPDSCGVDVYLASGAALLPDWTTTLPHNLRHVNIAVGDVNGDGLTDMSSACFKDPVYANNYEAVTLYLGIVDRDGDWAPEPEDCAPEDGSIYPGAPEIYYDGIDQDCNPDTADDDGDADSYPVDVDCRDNNPAVNPGAVEIPYDNRDQDCNPDTPDNDLDGDGSRWPNDCDDTDAARYPRAEEVPYDGVDQDCDSTTLDDDPRPRRRLRSDRLRRHEPERQSVGGRGDG